MCRESHTWNANINDVLGIICRQKYCHENLPIYGWFVLPQTMSIGVGSIDIPQHTLGDSLSW